MGKKKDRALERAISGLQRLADDFAERREQLASEAGLTPGQWRVLEEISTDEFMPSLFARRRAQSPAAVSKTLRQLAEAGLVEASIGRADARRRRYALTARGRRMLKKKVGGNAAKFALFMESAMNSFTYNARPLGSPTPSPFAQQGMGWHRKWSNYSIGYMDGHADHGFRDTRFTQDVNYNSWPEPNS